MTMVISVTFHGDELLGDEGTFKFKRSSRILSSRSKITTSWVFVTSKMYLRASGRGVGERLEIRALPVNRRRGLERRNLVREQRRVRKRRNREPLPRRIGHIGGRERLRAGQRIGADGLGLGVKNFGQLRLLRADDFFVIARDLHRRMNVLQADENDFCAEVILIRRGLDLCAQFLRRLQARVGHHVVQIHAGEIMHDFARGQILEQIRRVGVVVSPGEDVGDLKLNRNADGDEAHRRRLERVVGVGVFVFNRDRLAVADEEIFLLARG